MALITRYSQPKASGVLDEFDDGRSYAYYEGDRFSEAMIKIESDDTTSVVMYPHPDFDEIEAPGADVNISLAGYHQMDTDREHKWRLVFWFEYFWWPRIATVWQTNLAETRDNQIQLLKGALEAWYVDNTLSLNLATNLVDNSTKPKYTQIGLTDIPNLFVRIATGE